MEVRPEPCWDEVVTMPVEVTTPDRESARSLLDEAVGPFRAELVDTAEAHNLQVANVHHGNRSYAITAAARESRSDGGHEPAAAA
jgi:hypothetical protein